MLNNAVSLLADPEAIFFYTYSRANNTTLTSSHYIFSLSFRTHRASKPDFALVVRKITKIIKPTVLVPVSSQFLSSNRIISPIP